MGNTNLKRKEKLAKMQNLLFRTSKNATNAPPNILHDGLNSYKYAEAIIEAIHQPLVVLDKSLTTRAANKAFYKTFKLTKKQTLGQNLFLANNDSNLTPLIDKLNEISNQNGLIKEFEFTFSFPKLGERVLIINAQKIVIGKHITEFILLAIEDVTQRKIIDRQKDDFIGYVTHELKTPITTVSAYLQILQGYHSKTGDKKSQFLLTKMANQMERLTGLLNSFAYVYKAQTGKIELQISSLNLDTLVHDVVEAFQYTTSTHELQVKGRISKRVLADSVKIHEVLINLILNAIKYSPNANKVVIKMQETEKDAIISVTDYGFGITKEEQNKVFERFFRVKGKKENKIEGLGLGLYLVSEIIKQHKGKIWVKSTVGKGSTFTFSLPIK